MAIEPIHLDVRPILASGGHPLTAIREAVDCLQPGQALRLIAPFRPDPLFRLMEEKGFEAHVAELAGGGCEVLFVPRDEGGSEDPAIPSPLTWSDPVELLDLTDATPAHVTPRILEALDGLAEGDVIFVLLRQEPTFLYSELTSRRHGWVGNYDASGETYRCLIRRGMAVVAA